MFDSTAAATKPSAENVFTVRALGRDGSAKRKAPQTPRQPITCASAKIRPCTLAQRARFAWRPIRAQKTVMVTQTTIRALAALFRAKHEIRPIVLLGAGASFRSGVPLAAEAVKRIAKEAYIRSELGGKAHPGQVKMSQWLPWLTQQPWFVPGEDRLPENFPLAVQHLLRPDEFRREFLLEQFQPINGVSAGYGVLADFVLRGLVWTILTTNFDPCIPEALRRKEPHLKHVAQVNKARSDFAEFNILSRRQIVWLHGSAEHYTDRNLPDEIAHLDPELVSRLRPLMNDSPLVVIGYRGSEPSVMEDLLQAGATQSHNYRHGIYWCRRGGEALHPNVERLATTIGRNFHLIDIDGFDELMIALATELKGEDLYASQNAGAGLPTPPRSFDEQAMRDIGMDQLDHELMLATLTRYCATVGRAAMTAETLPALLRELGLVHSDGGKDVPTVGCCLLFARELPPALAHATVAVTRNGKNKTVTKGNLLVQRQTLIDVLDSKDFNPPLRVKGRRSYEERTAYPPRVLTELIVNLLVHRNYEVVELAEIDVEAGRATRFSNPGVISAELRDRLEIAPDGRITPLRSASSIRNPSIADIFFGIRSMERAGTGLVDVEDEMRRQGGDARFINDPSSGSFRAIALQPRQETAGVDVARPLAPLGLYVINSLPISVIPERISIAPLRPEEVSSFFRTDLSDLPTFIVHGDQLWSFAPAPVLALKLGERLAGRVETTPRTTIEADPEQRRLLSWLLNKHWQQHLQSFKSDGLFVQRKASRAYFQVIDGVRPVIVYDTPKRRNVRREMVKARAEDRWHENEGIGYLVVFMDGRWCIRVKPFYMFTGRDGIRPLPGFERTRRSTRRIKFDRNKNVDDDLTFWSRYLSRGQPTINIGGRDVDDLLLDAAFLTVEILEQGLLDGSADGHPNRMPA